MGHSKKDRYWLGRFEDYEQSGLSQRQYCNKHELVHSEFRYYWNKLIKGASEEATTAKEIFAPVALSSKSSTTKGSSLLTSVTLELPNNIRCKLTIDASINQLSELIQQLVASC